MADDESTPGWDAIDGALAPIYGSTKPQHFAPPIHAMLGGPDPIDGISAYRSHAFGDHWHFVTYGFSELYAKDENSDPSISGYGFELTFRVKAASGSVPAWALSFLQNLGRYVFKTGNGFDAGHYMNLNGPIALESATEIRAIVFAPDAELPRTIDTPHGSLSFLQIVGITLDELQVIKRWDGEKFIALAGSHLPGLVTDLARPSLLQIPEFAATVEAGVGRDGSSTATIYPGKAGWGFDGDLVITLGANGVRDLVTVLPARIAHGRPLLIAAGQAIGFLPGDSFHWEKEEDAARLFLPRELADAVAETLKPLAGDYRIEGMPGVVFRIEKSAIKDRDGNIVEWIG